MKFLKYIFFATAMFFGAALSAQQEAMYSQYMDMQLYANPAYAGSGEVMNFSAIHRQQWVGVQDAPTTTGLLIHTPISPNLGLGVDVMNDWVGVLGRMSAAANISYKFLLSETSQLSLGLKAMADQYSSRESSLLGAEIDILGQDSPAQLAINVGFGAYLKTKNMFVGIGAPRLLAQNLDEANGYVPLQQHGFVVAGTLLKLNSFWKLRPSVQLRATLGAPLNSELAATAIYRNRLWLGAMYRTQSATGVHAQFSINKQFKVGYAYDFPLAVGFLNTMGSHEISLSYDLDFHDNGVASPRFF